MYATPMPARVLPAVFLIAGWLLVCATGAHARKASSQPDTLLDTFPPDPGRSEATFTYHSADHPDATFECALDKSRLSACPSTGMTYAGLKDGTHFF